MAVYKSSYCFPFLNSIDSRIDKIIENGENVSEVYFSGKIETSNKNITGYKIKILDSDNNLIFEGKEISLFSELSTLPISETINKGINTGVNGSYFKIPVFQNKNKSPVLLHSYNCIYYDRDVDDPKWYKIIDNIPTFEPITSFTNEAGSYKWIITLYQGDTTNLIKSTTAPTYVDYTLLNDKEYDMVLTQGQVLGSTNERIQIKPSNQVIQNNYVQLFDEDENQIGTRSVIQTYDATMGHIYPIKYSDVEASFTQNDIEQAKYIGIFKYSNSEEDIKGRDIVKAATNGNITLNNTPTTIDDYTIQDGDRILVKNQTDSTENGIYTASTSGDWIRALDITKFADLIGRVIYVSDGNQKGKNFICQARAGGTFDLPSPSPIFFTEEQPLVLYSENINYTLDYYQLSAPTTSTDEIDGYSVKVGETVLTSNGFYKLDSIDDTTYTWEFIKSLEIEKIYAIKYGKINGGKIFIYSSSTLAETIDLQYTEILKNTPIKTYIKPFVGLEKGAKIFFDNNLVNPIIITEVNTTQWYVKHLPLTEPLSSYNPYKYKIKTFFKSSEENPFYTYDTPYLAFDLGPYSYYITEGKPFVVEPESGEDLEYFLVRNFIELNGEHIYTFRNFFFEGQYVQNQNVSWNNYRWLLSKENGEVVQDTGKIYNGRIESNFYGLANLNNYYVILIVEDNLGNSLSLGYKFKVDLTGADTELGISFTANFNSNLHAIELFFQDNGFVMPSVYKGGQTAVFESTDDSLSYSEGRLSITGAHSSEEANAVGEATTEGLTFKHWFAENQSVFSGNENQTLKTNDSGEISISSEHLLDGNFCGNIMKFNIEASNKRIAKITVFVPDNFTNLENRNNIDTLNEYRNKLVCSIQYDEGDIIAYEVIDGNSETFEPFILFEEQIEGGMNLNRQITNSVNFPSAYEYLEFNKVKIGNSYYKVWDYPLNSFKQINNLCLNSTGEGNGRYSIWREKKLELRRFGSYSQNFIVLDGEGAEVENVWNDVETTNNYWYDGDESEIRPIVEVKRHPDINTYYIILNIYIKDVDDLIDENGNLVAENIKVYATKREKQIVPL